MPRTAVSTGGRDMTYYYWDFDTDNVFLEEDENGNVIAEYTQEPGLYGQVIAQERNGEVRYYNFDGEGSTRELTDENGDVTDTYTYSAFGEEVERSGTTVNPFGYKGALGYYTSGETNDIYVRARLYHPTVARWRSRDPLGFVAGTDVYLYVQGDPVNLSDPSGMEAVSDDANCLCCCKCWALNLVFEMDYDDAPLRGHRFGLEAFLNYEKSYYQAGDCTLEWWEYSNTRIGADLPPRTWKNRIKEAGASRYPTLRDWFGRKRPCPDSERVLFADRPSEVGRGPSTHGTRILFIAIRIVNGCVTPFSTDVSDPCPPECRIFLVQHLHWHRGKLIRDATTYLKKGLHPPTSVLPPGWAPLPKGC